MDARTRKQLELDELANGRRRRSRTARNRRRYRWLRITLIVLGMLSVIAVGAVAGTVYAITRDLPDINTLVLGNTAQTTRFYDVNGKAIGALLTGENRMVAEASQIPEVMKQATVAIEDKRFYDHSGVDYEGIVRAAWIDLRSRSFKQGAGTITGQYVRAYLTDKNKVVRKIKEMALAREIEQKWTKDQILTAYLNMIYYGSNKGANAYGVAMAAKVWFHKDVSKLTLEEAALLAGIANMPSYYTQTANAEAAKRRRNEVLLAMRSQGYITAEEATAAMAKPLGLFRTAPEFNKAKAQYFIDYATKELVNLPGITIQQAYAGGLKVYTSLDLDWQNAAYNDIKNLLTSADDPGAALVAIDPKTGYIKAMVGGTNFKKQQFNLATMSGTGRALGSAAKPFILTTAVEQGMDPFHTYYTDKDIEVPNPGGAEDPYPVASEGKGTILVSDATAISVNSVFVQLGQDVGLENAIHMMHLLGIKSPMYAWPSAPLGTNNYNPLEVASAYATLAAGGVYHTPRAITKVEAADGTVLYDATDQVKGKRVISKGVAYVVTQCLTGVITHGTASRYGYIGRPAAGKTGTTDKHYNAWFIGYTPQLATAVWMGYPEENIPMTSVHGISVWGGDFPTLIWSTFMKAALKDLPVAYFEQPAEMPIYLEWNKKWATTSPSPSPSPTPSKTKKPTPGPSKTDILPSISPTTSPTTVPTTSPTTGPTTVPIGARAVLDSYTRWLSTSTL